jgi:hypothetical protein
MTVNAYTQTQPTQYQNTYVPIPFQEMMAVSQAYKQSYDQAQERQDKFIELSSQLGQTMIPGSGDAAVFQKEMAGVSGQIDALVNQDLRDPIVQGKLSQLQRGFMKNPFWGSAQANAKLWALQEQNKQKLIMDGKWSTVQEQDWQNYVAGFNSGDNKPFNGSLRAYNDNFDQMIATGMTGWDKYLQETRKANFANDFTSTWETDKNWREQQYGLIANAMANSEQGKLVIRNGIAEGQLKLTGDAEKDAKIAKEWLWKNYGEKTARSFVKTEHRENRSMYKMWEKSLEAGGSDRPQLTPSGPPIMGSESGLSMNDILNGKGEDAQAAYSRARNEFSSAPETDNPGVKDAYNQLDKFIKSTAGESGLKGVARMTNEDHADIMKKYNVDQGDLNDVIKTIAYAYGSGVTANEQLAEIAGKLIGKKVDETDVV